MTGLFTKNKTISKILLSLLITLSFLSANAQFNKGDLLVGGTMSYSSNKSTSPYITDIQNNNSGMFNINLGKAIKENAIFGINLIFQPSSSSNDYGSGPMTTKTNNYGIGIYYRVYKNLGKGFYFFGEAGAGYNGSSTSTKDSTGIKLSTGSGYGGNIYLTPGIAYKISKKFFLELSIPQLFSAVYSSTTTKTGGSIIVGSTDQYYVNANINSNPLNSFGIGFRLVL